jgi:tripartite-type tricarboxylate transporter receptor subunit TctC
MTLSATSRHRGVFQKYGNLGNFGAFGGYAMKLPRRTFLHLAAGAAALPAVSRFARAQTYPTRPVHIVVGVAAGGPNDTVARLLSQWLSERLGQQFVVENHTGAGGTIATEAVVRAPADGYTLLLVTSSNAVNVTLYDKSNFVTDIAPVAAIMRVPNVMVVNPSVPAKTVLEFIAYAKANPGKINMGTAGNGTTPHMSGELFKQIAGVDLVPVAYRGGAPALIDLIAGRIQVMFEPTISTIPYVRAGKLRALAVTTATRSGLLPDIPTVSESVPGYEVSQWYGIGTPKNTPTEIVAKLNQEINAVITDPKLTARLAELGGISIPMTTAEFAKLISDEIEKWAKVIQIAHIKLE